VSAPASTSPDVVELLARSGVAELTHLSAAADVRAAVEVVARFAREVTPVLRAQLIAEAREHMRAARVIGGPQALSAAVWSSAPARRPSHPSPLDDDPLPEGVDPHTDLASAHRIARDHGEDLRHCGALGWFAWDGMTWRADAGEATRRAMASARVLLRLAVDVGDVAETAEQRAQADRYLAWSRRAQGEPSIRRALELAQHIEPIATTAAVWDRDPWLLACSNGTLDLRTLELREHRREDMITRACPVAYDPAAPAPAWQAFVERVLPDAELRAFVQRALGYSLTGATGEQCLMVTHGTGANGKTTLLEAVRYVLGDYAAHAQTATLMHARERGADNDLVRLRGARFVTAVESAEGQRLDEARIKQLTGGDTITARLLYREPIEFSPQLKIWLATNHRPEVRGTDHAIWRRLRLIPWTVQIPEGERDGGLPAKLRAEAQGILRWLVEGCAEWQRGGLQAPASVLAATTEWRGDSDLVAQFIADRCVVMPGVQVTAGALYADFRAWALEQGLEPMSQTALGRRLADAGHQQRRTSRARLWVGIGLHAEGGE
jgi:putative DNA primase/helicase